MTDFQDNWAGRLRAGAIGAALAAPLGAGWSGFCPELSQRGRDAGLDHRLRAGWRQRHHGADHRGHPQHLRPLSGRHLRSRKKPRGRVGWPWAGAMSSGSRARATASRPPSGSFVTTPLQADTPWQPADFTPVALLATRRPGTGRERLVRDRGISRASSPMRRKTPITIAGTGTVNVDFIVPTLFATGGRLRVRVCSRSTRWPIRPPRSCRIRSMRWSATRARSWALIDSGDLRPLVLLGLVHAGRAWRRADDLGDVGHDIGVSMPRGLILPPNAPEEAQEFSGSKTMQRVVETPEWAEYIATNTLTADDPLWR